MVWSLRHWPLCCIKMLRHNCKPHIQATAHTPPEGAHRHVSTVKMVATNLLSEGRLWEGVQLLALTGQVPAP